MKNRILRAGAALALLSFTLGMAKATPQTKTKPAAPECPVCHMALSKKKTKDSPVAIKLTPKAKTMYCCAKCTMPAAMVVPPKAVKKPPTTKGK